MTYTVVKRTGPMVVVSSDRYTRQPWLPTVLRKPAVCKNCKTELAPRTRAFRPLDNGLNRADRLCVPCVDGPSAGS